MRCWPTQHLNFSCATLSREPSHVMPALATKPWANRWCCSKVTTFVIICSSNRKLIPQQISFYSHYSLLHPFTQRQTAVCDWYVSLNLYTSLKKTMCSCIAYVVWFTSILCHICHATFFLRFIFRSTHLLCIDLVNSFKLLRSIL